MRLLLTNDDGIEADGLQALRSELLCRCDSVVTVVPESNRSGYSRACTFARPVVVTQIDGGRHPVFVCDGTPVDCVRAAILGHGVTRDLDLVVSGINHGANLGEDVHYSGTVGAGLEAGQLGVSALCVSQQAPTGTMAFNDVAIGSVDASFDFRRSAPRAAEMAALLAEPAPVMPLVLNVNFPASQTGKPVVTTPGRRIYAHGGLRAEYDNENRRAFYLFGRPGDDAEFELDPTPGSDFDALANDQISITPLTTPFTSAGLSAEDWAVLDRLVTR
jgi:5'-nucleotidase